MAWIQYGEGEWVNEATGQVVYGNPPSEEAAPTAAPMSNPVRLQTQFGETGDLTPEPNIPGAYRASNGDIVSPQYFGDTQIIGGFTKYNPDTGGFDTSWTPPSSADWAPYTQTYTAWAARPDVQAIHRQQGAGDSFMDRYGPGIMAAIPTLGGSIAAAGGVGNYVSNLGTSIANLPSTISDAVSNLPTTLSNAATSASDFISGLGSSGSVQGGDLVGTLGSGGGTVDMTGFMTPDPFTAATPYADLVNNPLPGSGFITDPTGAGLAASQSAVLSTMGLPAAGTALNLANSAAGMVPTTTAMGGSVPMSITTGAGGAAAGTALSRLLNGNATTADYLSLLGNVGAAGIGAYAANQQGDAMRELGAAEDARIREFMAYGAPSRARYEATFAPGFDPKSMPGFTETLDTSWETMLRKLSTGGNPFGNPGALTEANKYITGSIALPALERYRAQNANTGGYAPFNTSAAQGPDLRPTMAASSADSGFYNALGYGARSVLNPPTPVDDLISRLGAGNRMSLA